MIALTLQATFGRLAGREHNEHALQQVVQLENDLRDLKAEMHRPVQNDRLLAALSEDVSRLERMMAACTLGSDLPASPRMTRSWLITPGPSRALISLAS